MLCFCGRTPRWVRGLKLLLGFRRLLPLSSRTPRWVRGLKFCLASTMLEYLSSHPTMGAWIEICLSYLYFLYPCLSHPTMGAWIEINPLAGIMICKKCRTPRWVRGLKSLALMLVPLFILSHPTMGAWIEILLGKYLYNASLVAPHDGCVD